jgi:hypothetical protein
MSKLDGDWPKRESIDSIAREIVKANEVLTF